MISVAALIVNNILEPDALLWFARSWLGRLLFHLDRQEMSLDKALAWLVVVVVDGAAITVGRFWLFVGTRVIAYVIV